MSYIRAIRSVAGKALSTNGFRLNSSPQIVPIGPLRLISVFEKLSLEKVPIRPKRPANGYTIFFKELTPKVMAENPGLRVTNLAKRVSEEWNKLDAKTKEEYVERGKSNLNDYKIEREKWLKSLTEKQTESLQNAIKTRKKSLARRRLKVQLKKLEFPTRPQSAYSLFVKDSIPKRSGDKEPIKEVFKQISVEWKNLSDAQKAPFVESAKNDKLRYLEEMQKWKDNIAKPENEEVLKKLIDLRAKGFISSRNIPSSEVKKKAKKVVKTKAKSIKAKSTKAKSAKSKLTKTKSTKSGKAKSTKSTKTTKTKSRTGKKVKISSNAQKDEVLEEKSV